MSTEIPGSDVRILTAFSVNIHKRKKAFSLLNAWVWHKKKGPPFYLGLRLLEMFIAISETIARPENNAKNSALLFCVIFGVSIRIRSRADICAAHPARSAVFRIRSRSVSLCSCGCWTDVLLLPGTGQSLPVIHLLFRKPDRSQRPV